MKPASNRKKGKPSIFGLLKPYSTLVGLLVLFALLGNGLNLWIPKIIGNGIDAYTDGSFAFRPLIIEFVAVVTIVFILTYSQSIIQTYTSERVARDLRARLSGKIAQQSFAYIEAVNPSKLLTNLTADVDSIKLFVSQAIVSIASSLFIIIGASILLLSIDWKLGLVVIAIIPIIGTVFFMVLRKVKTLFKESRAVIDWLNKIINESILGAALIRVINSQQLEYDKFLEANTKARDYGLAILRLFAGLIPVIIFTANMAGLAILLLGGHFVIIDSMTLGDFAAFNSYLALLIFPILVIGFMSNVIAQASASYERIVSVLETPEVEQKGTVTAPIKGELELREINLAYDQKPVLKNISFSVEAGSRTAVLGPTAAGKSQLLYLLTGLVPPDSGTISYDKRPILEYRAENFYGQVGFVFQDSIIFNMSIRENIAFSDTVTDDSLAKAIETAELHSFIQELPNGLDTVVSERGSSLSGGQKQRIMLARALAIDPKVLLLDDFTARVDNNTEKKILGNIKKNYPDLTLVSVTQKIASVSDYEQIILIMQGEMIASGTHRELLETCPEYVQIFNSQQSTSNYELSA